MADELNAVTDQLNVKWARQDLESRAQTIYPSQRRFEADRYTSLEFLAREDQSVWRHAWQIACLESEVSDVGDYVEYRIANESILVIRETRTRLRALSNVCRHRATGLKSGSGHARELRCPFHGWRYGLDGSLLEIVNDWDFPETRVQSPCLPEFLLETWQGFVFINLDPHAEPLAEFLGPLLREFDGYAMDSRYRAAAIRLVLPCNWKIAAASFPETYHVPWTHPQIGSWVSDVDSTFFPLGLHGKCVNARRPSPNNAFEVDDETYLAEQLGFLNQEAMDAALEQLENGHGAREILAHVQREYFLAKGFDFADQPDDEFVDGRGYWVFPNTIAYVGLGTAGHVLRFLPNGRDPNTCVAELWLMSFPDDANVPMANVPMSTYPPGTSVTEAFEDSYGFHPLGPVLDQDLSNLESIQRGLQSAYYPGVSFGLYQESLIRNFEEALDSYLERFDKSS